MCLNARVQPPGGIGDSLQKGIRGPLGPRRREPHVEPGVVAVRPVQVLDDAQVVVVGQAAPARRHPPGQGPHVGGQGSEELLVLAAARN